MLNVKANYGDAVYSSSLKEMKTLDALASLVGLPQDILSQVLIDTSSQYTSFKKKKKKGGFRVITAPKKYLRDAQSRLKIHLEKSIKWPVYLHGGIEDRSPITNAKRHVAKKVLLNLDIRNFFPSTSIVAVTDLFAAFGASPDMAESMAQFCCFDGAVPQGAPTSTLLTNLIFAPTDVMITNIIGRASKVAYTRYVDDISLSGEENIIGYRGYIEKVIKDSGYDISLSTITKRNKEQIVTGLIVNDKLKPTNEFIDTLEEDIDLCLDEAIGIGILSDMYGVTISKMKKNIHGRIMHLDKFSQKRSKKLFRRARNIGG